LKYWDNASTYSDTDFSTGAFWVQVHGLPLDMTSEKDAHSIGSCFGDLLKIDYADSGLLCRKSFIRLRVQINLMDPLAPGFTHRRPPKEPTWIQYKYERLFDFCYTCGRLGHLSFSCPVEPKPLDSGFYGPLLKVVPPKVNLVDVLIQSSTLRRLVLPPVLLFHIPLQFRRAVFWILLLPWGLKPCLSYLHLSYLPFPRLLRLPTHP
jgi:hypothetical protein